MVDVSAQGSCTVTPINPTTLTAASGVLPIGTENVMIQCNCSGDDDMTISTIGWYDPNGTGLSNPEDDGFMDGAPHFTRADDDTNIVLVIPIFTNSYDGTYTCGSEGNDAPGMPNAIANLTISGK